MKAPTFAVAVVLLSVVTVALVVVLPHAYYQIEPGFRGIEVSGGAIDPQVKLPGTHWKLPLFTRVTVLPVRWSSHALSVPCYTSDRKAVNVGMTVVYRIPEKSENPGRADLSYETLVNIYQEFGGDPFDDFVVPHLKSSVQLAVHKVAAEDLVKMPETVVTLALVKTAFAEVSPRLQNLDLRLESVALPAEFVAAVAAVDPAEAARDNQRKDAKFKSDLALLQAKAEADALRAHIDAFTGNTVSTQLFQRLVDKWDGKTPFVFPGMADPASPEGKVADNKLPAH